MSNSSGDLRSPSELVEQRLHVPCAPLPYTTTHLLNTIYSEPETGKRMFRPVFLQMDYQCYSRILSENILDLMHIPFTHTFGNVDHPAPIHEDPPTVMDDFPYHYQSRYLYKTSNHTIAKFIFGSEVVTIENEFILPHTTISRVIFDKYVKQITNI